MQFDMKFLLISLLAVLMCCDFSVANSEELKCDDNKWKCINQNRCINQTNLCDGISDCLDISDENSKFCSQFPSDRRKKQSPIHNKVKRQSNLVYGRQEKNCRIPNKQFMKVFDNDAIGYYDNVPSLQYGQQILDGQTVFIKCQNGYIVDSNSFNICIDGEWMVGFPTCRLQSGCKVEFIRNGIMKYPNEQIGFGVGEIVPDTHSVQYKCANDYQLVGTTTNICVDDAWVNRHPYCEQRLPSNGCTITDLPNMKVSYKFGTTIRLPNAFIDDTATITYECLSGYTLHGIKENICVGNDWVSVHPVCEKPGSGCRVPNVPNLMVLRTPDNQIIQPGEYVTNFVSVKYKCASQHASIGSLDNLCVNDAWRNEIPVCEKYCPEEDLQSHMLSVTCLYKNRKVPCTHIIRENTRAVFTCNEGYKELEGTLNNDIVCQNGKWSTSPKKCVPDCGGELKQINAFITNGNESKTYVPWHVGIYFKDNYQYKCGGTIISSNIIISAAHCFWDGPSKRLFDKAIYTIAAGKLKREYNDVADRYAQKVNILELHVPSKFNIEIFYNDIAVIVLSQRIVFNLYIKPACLDWNLLRSQSEYNGKFGFLAGWGKTETGLYSDILNTGLMRALNRQECINRNAWTPAEDQFCAGEGSVSACVGDSGGGLTLINKNKLFSIWGIVSYGEYGSLSQTCAGNYKASYTDILLHQSFVVPILQRNSPEVLGLF